ncbi:protein FAR1-RELATED SEQUENCE 6-like isoform X4 [Musa acuminata AAA Group]|uniref:protein FAR1-RELATED SEQUENCE 6-like isoform X4 n=1 Tax=Musa acuminata AAA Group TaxID=214697 RepID=UPI0031DBCC20
MPCISRVIIRFRSLSRSPPFPTPHHASSLHSYGELSIRWMEPEEGLSSSGDTSDEIIDEQEMESSAENKNEKGTENILEDNAIMTVDKNEHEAEHRLEDYATMTLEKNEQEAENQLKNDATATLHNKEQGIQNRLDDDTIVPLKKNEQETLLEDNAVINPPVRGMTFYSLDALVEYYNNYAKQEGFGIMRRAISFSADGKSKFVTIACSRVGKSYSSKRNILNPNPLKKTGCKARVNATVFESGSCRVNSVVLEHNHVLFPSKSCFFLCNRKINYDVKTMLEINNVEGVDISKSSQSVIAQSKGSENVSTLGKDCRNTVEKAKRLRLEVGDAESMYDYFVRMQAKNSNFFYVMDIDCKSHIRNVFWADARCRAAYEEFGDVVMFDTSYLTNKYNMPLSTFVGVNHHGQAILFGCGLLLDEEVETFIWLFKTWLSCMSGCAPIAIITTQSEAIRKAVEMVFPDTRHSWCLWHILKTVPEKLGSYEMCEPITNAIQHAVYDASTKKEFEDSWADIIKAFKELESDEWLTNLYEERNYWVPAFGKDTFWAGMLSTQHGETMNPFFDGNVSSMTTIKQFLEQYNDIFKSKVEKENQADIQSFNSQIPCVTHFPIEKQFQQVYTIEKFKEFQQEVIAKLYCEVCLVREMDGVLEFSVSEILAVGEENNQHHRTLDYKVYFNKEEKEINCSCCLFEFRGILCRHIVSVLIKIQSDITVSSKYVLSRWRKDLSRHHTRVKVCHDDWSSNFEGQRYHYLLKKFDDAADLAVASDDACKILWNCIDDFQQKLKVNDAVNGNNKPSLTSGAKSAGCEDTGESFGSVIDKSKLFSPIPITVRWQGCPSTKRKVSTVEQAAKKLTCTRTNGQCGTSKEKGNKFQDSEMKQVADDEGDGIDMLRSHVIVDIDSQESINIQANSQVGPIFDQYYGQATATKQEAKAGLIIEPFMDHPRNMKNTG